MVVTVVGFAGGGSGGRSETHAGGRAPAASPSGAAALALVTPTKADATTKAATANDFLFTAPQSRPAGCHSANEFVNAALTLF
jgi:hypothetical protein